MAVAAVPLITGVAAGGLFAATATVGILGLTVLQSAILIGVGTAALGILSTVMQPSIPKPQIPNLGSFANQVRTSLIRQAISARRLPFGEVIISGILTFYEVTESDKYHHMVVTLGDAPLAPWDGIDIVWLDNEPIFNEQLDEDGNVIEGKFKDKIRVKKHLGGPDQEADADLIAEIDRLDSNFRGRGIAYIYLRVDWDRDAFPSGLPKPKVLARTNKPFDPRDSQRRYSNNVALCLREYLVEAQTGLGYDASLDLNDDFFETAANLCDEIVDAANVGHAVIAVNTEDDYFELGMKSAGSPIRFETGDRVRINANTSLPGGLSDTAYYVIVDRLVGDNFTETTTLDYSSISGTYSAEVTAMLAAGTLDRVYSEDEANRPRVKLATSYANALARVAVDITSEGSGQLTIFKTGEPRYTCSGVIETDRTRQDNILDFLSALGGKLLWTGGQFQLLGGEYPTPLTEVFDEADLMGPLSVQTKRSKRERFNSIKGIFATHLTLGEATDYPSVVDDDYVYADGETIFADIDFPLTSRAAMAQRLAKLVLSRHRREITVQYPTTLKGMLAKPGSIVKINNTRRGWVEKTFEVVDLEHQVYETEGGPILGVMLNLAELDATAFDFDASVDETIKPPRQSAPGGNPLLAPPPPTGMTLSSGTEVLGVRLDGTVFSRIKVAWTAPASAFVTGGGRIEIRYKLNDSGSVWQPAQFVAGDMTEAFILDVIDGEVYDVAIRSVNSIGRVSDTATDPDEWQTKVEGHTVVGKTEAPTDVASLFVQQNGNVVTFKWPPITDKDRGGYELRYAQQGSFNSSDFRSNTLITRETKGTLITNAALPPGAWTIGIVAVDTSDNISETPTTYDITVTNSNDIITTETYAPEWLGILEGFIRHDVSGRLVPDSDTLAADMTDAQLWDQMVYDPVASPSFEAPEIGLGFDANAVRVFSDITGVIGPGESGQIESQFQIDYRDAADSYDGFEDWVLGLANFRYLKAKFVLDTTEGVAYIDEFEVTADTEEREEEHLDLVIAPGGTTLTFDTPFHTVPNVQITAETDSGPRIATYSSVTTTGVLINVWNTSDTDVGGTVNVTVTGA